MMNNVREIIEKRQKLLTASLSEEYAIRHIVEFAEKLKEAFSTENSNRGELDAIAENISDLEDVLYVLDDEQLKASTEAKISELKEKQATLSRYSVPVEEATQLQDELNTLLIEYYDAADERANLEEQLQGIKVSTDDLEKRFTEIDKQILAMSKAKHLLDPEEVDRKINELKFEKSELKALINEPKNEPKIETTETAHSDVVTEEAEPVIEGAKETKNDDKLARAYLNFVQADYDTIPQGLLYQPAWRDFFQKDYFNSLSEEEKNSLIAFLNSDLAVKCKVNSQLFLAVEDAVDDEEVRANLRASEALKTSLVGRAPIAYKELAEYDAIMVDYLKKLIGGSPVDEMDFGKFIYKAS